MTKQQSSWKNEFYVWMIIAIPLTAVIVGVLMLTLAINSDSGLVADDYYKLGKQINRVLARDEQARTRGLSAVLKLDAKLALMEIHLSSTDTTVITEPLSINLYHRTQPGRDQTLLLEKINNWEYIAEFDELNSGRWVVQLSTDSWRIMGSLVLPGKTSIDLVPAQI